VSKVLNKVGIDSRQYFLLLALFRKLDDRREFSINSTKVARYTMVVSMTLVLAVISYLDVLSDSVYLSSFIKTDIVMTALLLLLILVTETINTFFNPVEAAVFAHQPVHERTYFASRITCLLGVTGSTVLLPNVIPALAGLSIINARWFYPVTHLVALSALGVFMLFSIIAVLGLLFRFAPLSRVRGIAALGQVAVCAVLLLYPTITGGFHIDIPAAANPLGWFLALGTYRQETSSFVLDRPALLTMILFGTVILWGGRALSKGYLTNVRLLLRGVPKRTRSKQDWFGPVMRRITGRPSGRAAFSFIYSMAKSDWHFRLSLLPVLFLYVLFPAITIMRKLDASPLSGRPGLVYLLPHLAAFGGFTICSMLPFSDQHRAAWIYLTAPLDGIRSFVTGIFWALWIPLGAGSAVLAPVFAWYWGIPDALLFVAYSAALGSFYLSLDLLLVDGLPFANPPRQTGSFLGAPLVIGNIVAVVGIVLLQRYVIFQYRLVTIGSVVAFAAAAYAITGVSIRHLQTNVLYNLHAIASGRGVMFKEVE
jgi:ABC-2 type transport system permease protein